MDQSKLLFYLLKFENNNRTNFRINSYNDQYNKHDHQVMFELPNDSSKSNQLITNFFSFSLTGNGPFWLISRCAAGTGLGLPVRGSI